jgi:hypothetical protein
MYGKVEIIMRTKAAQANPNPGPLDTVIPTGKEGDAGDAEIVKPPIDFALLTAIVQSTAPSSRERLAKPEKRAARRNVNGPLTIPLYKSVISVLYQPNSIVRIRT